MQIARDAVCADRYVPPNSAQIAIAKLLHTVYIQSINLIKRFLLS